MATNAAQLVVPGQVICTSTSEGEGGFLKGHGTYAEDMVDEPHVLGRKRRRNRDDVMENDAGGAEEHADDTHDEHVPVQQKPQRLLASVVGTVERVHKLISVVPVAPHQYQGQVGDLVVGRIAAVGATRWKVNLGSGKSAQLPLSGVNLPQGVQRIRTHKDALQMSTLFREGDLVSAEVQAIQQDGQLILHTRSMRYGKLENGSLISVPPALIRRMPIHFCTLEPLVNVDILMGVNGSCWIQRSLPKVDETHDNAVMMATHMEELRKVHAKTPVLPSERRAIARVHNAIQCLSHVYSYVTPDTIRGVYQASLSNNNNNDTLIQDMLQPPNVVQLTSFTRSPA